MLSLPKPALKVGHARYKVEQARHKVDRPTLWSGKHLSGNTEKFRSERRRLFAPLRVTVNERVMLRSAQRDGNREVKNSCAFVASWQKNLRVNQLHQRAIFLITNLCALVSFWQKNLRGSGNLKGYGLRKSGFQTFFYFRIFSFICFNC